MCMICAAIPATAAAGAKLSAKGVDLLVANDVTTPGIGFGADSNAVTVFAADGGSEEWPRQSKDAIANRLWDLVVRARSR